MNCEIQLVSIEGNIGSGKSTLLANLRKHFDGNHRVVFLKEPVDEWEQIKDQSGVTMLEKFYADQEKYSFPFQMMAYISRLKLLRETYLRQLNSTEKTQIIVITERSLFTDKLVFAKMLYDTGKIEHINYQIYLKWFHTFADDFPIHKIIYVQTAPEVCHARIGKRSREGEDNIPLDYLVACNQYHENMLDKSSSECVCQEQLVLNGNIDIYQETTVLESWIKTIEEFIC
jgi:deoxyadenosine/deoxycytidine kinase